ncbi:MAG: hypothetical protein FWE45_04415 [Firmicutes bacterium]|nr:hypothetical protein [Bacillota bacterium]
MKKVSKKSPSFEGNQLKKERKYWSVTAMMDHAGGGHHGVLTFPVSGQDLNIVFAKVRKTPGVKKCDFPITSFEPITYEKFLEMEELLKEMPPVSELPREKSFR